MHNELILFFEIAAVFAMVLVSCGVFGRDGLIAWTAIATVMANIITAKNATVFGFDTAIGTVMFASTFLATDILSECYSKNDAKRAVYIGLFADGVLIIATQIALKYIPSIYDHAHTAMEALFSFSLRISVASALMYFVANIADIVVFDKLRRKTGGKFLWLRNNVSTIVCNCVENFGFITIAFVGIYDWKTIITISLSTSVIEAIVAVCDTPFLYIARRIVNRRTRVHEGAI